MNIFKRLFKIGQAEANSTIDKMEDPIKMTEQGIRDLKTDLAKNMESLAQVKALSIRTKNEMEELFLKAKDYQEKAIIILQKAKKGDIEAKEADRLAKEALIKKEETDKQAKEKEKELKKFNESVLKLEKNTQKFKQTINKWENELNTLKARVKVSAATKNLNKQIAEIDNSSTVEMLKRMKNKILQEEALAQAYSELSESSKNIDQKLTEKTSTTDISAEKNLLILKEKLGLNN